MAVRTSAEFSALNLSGCTQLIKPQSDKRSKLGIFDSYQLLWVSAQLYVMAEIENPSLRRKSKRDQERQFEFFGKICHSSRNENNRNCQFIHNTQGHGLLLHTKVEGVPAISHQLQSLATQVRWSVKAEQASVSPPDNPQACTAISASTGVRSEVSPSLC